jgi:hypothetical protein
MVMGDRGRKIEVIIVALARATAASSMAGVHREFLRSLKVYVRVVLQKVFFSRLTPPDTLCAGNAERGARSWEK